MFVFFSQDCRIFQIRKELSDKVVDHVGKIISITYSSIFGLLPKRNIFCNDTESPYFTPHTYPGLDDLVNFLTKHCVYLKGKKSTFNLQRINRSVLTQPLGCFTCARWLRKLLVFMTMLTGRSSLHEQQRWLCGQGHACVMQQVWPRH